MRNKILKTIGALLLIVTALIVLSPFAFKPAINNWVKNQINSGINGRVDYSDISISYFRDFPDADISLHKLFIESNSAPLMKADEITFTLDIRTLFSDSFKILSCKVNRPQLMLRTDSSGNCNWNILKPYWFTSSGAAGSNSTRSIAFQVNDYKVSQGEVQYFNDNRPLGMHIQGLNLTGSISSNVQSSIDIGSLELLDSGKVYLRALNAHSLVHYSLQGDSLVLDSLDGQVGKNKLHVTGVFRQIFSGGSGNPAECRLQFQSSHLDADSLFSSFSTIFNRPASTPPIASAQPAQVKPVETEPKRPVKIIAAIAFDTVLLNKFSMYQVKAQVEITKDSISLTSFSCAMLGGRANGQINILAQRNVQMKIDVSGCDIQQSCKAAPVVSKFAPVAQYMDGSFSFALTAAVRLDGNMNPDYNTLTGVAKIQSGKTRIKQMPVLEDIGGLSSNANLANALVINPTACEMRCKNREIKVDPTDVIFSNGLKLKLSGIHSLNGDMNYDVHLDVPTAHLGGIAGMGRDILSAIPGLNIKVPEVLSFSFKVTGTVEKPHAALTGIGQ